MAVNADHFAGVFLGIAACLILLVALLLGFSIGESWVISDCDNFGAFTSGDVTYICERSQQ